MAAKLHGSDSQIAAHPSRVLEPASDASACPRPRRQTEAGAAFNRDSGAMHGHRDIAGGGSVVRNVPCMAALTASHRNPVNGALCQRLRNRGRRAEIAIVAAIRKLIAILNAIIRDGAPWRSA